MRREEPETALRCLDRLHGFESAAMRCAAIDARMSALRALDRDAEALDLGMRTLNRNTHNNPFAHVARHHDEWRDAESER